MKYITKEERDSQVWISSGGASAVFTELVNMQVGQILYIDAKDWNKNYPLSQTVWYISKKYKRKFLVKRKPKRLAYAIERLA